MGLNPSEELNTPKLYPVISSLQNITLPTSITSSQSNRKYTLNFKTQQLKDTQISPILHDKKKTFLLKYSNKKVEKNNIINPYIQSF